MTATHLVNQDFINYTNPTTSVKHIMESPLYDFQGLTEDTRRLHIDSRSVAEHVLPRDVIMTLNNETKIVENFRHKLNLQKEMVGKDIDDTLKKFIFLMEELKQRIFSKIEQSGNTFDEFLNNFKASCADCVKIAQDNINILNNSKDLGFNHNENDQ